MNQSDKFYAEENQKTESFDKDAWSAAKRQERERIFSLIDDTAIRAAKDGDIFRSYLNVQSRFDRYSVSNALLIAAQMPEATKLRGFDTWKESGVSLKKGTVGINILAPGEEYKREDGGIGVSYNIKKVFDISQTTSINSKTNDPQTDLRAALKAIINSNICPIAISTELPDNIAAAYDKDKKTVFIRQGMDGAEIFRSLSQELAHAYMDTGNYSRRDCDFPAYCTAYILCRRVGVSVEPFRFDRMPAHMQTMDAHAVRSELGRIRSAANALYATISKDLNRTQDRKSRETR